MCCLSLVLWGFWETLERNFGWVYFIQHAGIYVMLAALFGVTLTRGRQPLCTRLAEAVRGSLDSEVVRYTRKVTLAWTLFFLGMSLISTVLFLFGTMEAWSVFANFLSLPLVLLMFVAEHLVRLRKLPHLEQHSIMESILAFRRTPKVCPVPPRDPVRVPSRLTMSTLPLIAHDRPDAVVAWRDGVPVRVRQMQRIAPDAICIIGKDDRTVDPPTVRYPDRTRTPKVHTATLHIDCGQVIAQVVTSGSTGVPEPRLKRRGSLVRNVQAAAKRLGATRAYAIVGTGPARHTHGLESLAGFTGVERTEGDAAIRQAGCAYAASLERQGRAEPFKGFNCFDDWRRPAGDGPTPS